MERLPGLQLLLMVLFLCGCAFGSESAVQDHDSGTTAVISPVAHGDSAGGTVPPPSADSVYALPVMVVRPDKATAKNNGYVESRRSVTPREIKKKAGAAEDITRYLGSLPSVVSSLGAGYDNTLFIRGGRPAEVVFLVDGIEMEGINHFSRANGSGGPVGFIANDQLASLDFYAGNLPVSFPARLSSAVDIAMKKGSLYERRHSLGLKMTGGQFTAEGPLARGAASYNLSGRYVDFSAMRSYVKDAGIPRAGDCYGKLFAIAGDHLDLSATALLSWNQYHYWYPIARSADDGTVFPGEQNEVERILQGGAGATLRYLSDNLTHQTRFSVSFRDGRDADSLSVFSDTFFVNRYRSNPLETDRDRRIRYAFNSTSRFRLSDFHSMKAGMRLGVNSYRFRNRDESRFEGECTICRQDTPVTFIVRKEPTVKEVALYGIEPGAFLEYAFDRGPYSATLGFRSDYFDLLDDVAFSPRAGLSVKLGCAGTVSASAGRYSQFPTEMPSLIFAWLPPTQSDDSIAAIERRLLGRIEPQRLWQGSLGYNRILFDRHEFLVETYYKWYDREYDLLTPDLPRILYWNEHGELSAFAQKGKRRALGCELSLAGRNLQPVSYAVGVSVFDVKNRYQGGAWYNDWTDIGYTCSISFWTTVMNVHLFSFSLQGAGGRPYCPEKIIRDCIDRKLAVYDDTAPWFSRRLEPLLNASTRYAFTRRIGACRTEAFLELLNAFDYTPTLEYKWNGDRFIEVKPFSITPIAGCSVNW